MIRYKGSGISPGAAVGKLLVRRPQAPRLTMEALTGEEISGELARYEAGLARAEDELSGLIQASSEGTERDILSVQLEMLRDPVVGEEIRARIAQRRLHADRAADLAYEAAAAALEDCGDPFLAQRADDLRDVKNRLLRCCAGEDAGALSRLEEPVILAARDLMPSETAGLDRTKVLGIVTERGGAASHAAILARSLGIPAVLGVPALMEQVRDGETVALDGGTGEVVLEPDEETAGLFLQRRERYIRERTERAAAPAGPARTADGVRIHLGANLGSAEEAELAGAAEADCVGLFRTEFLYMNSGRIPGEEEQFLAYRRVLEAFAPRPVTLRTLDLGGDKDVPGLELPREENPFLGCRAFRLCLERPELLRPQLRAALRAAAWGKLRLMFPMIGSLEDIRAARALVEGAKDELDREGIPRGEAAFGVMVEVPSIALMADLAAEEVDFASVGTNDLCQYLMAADRDNHLVSRYYQSCHPALFRCLGEVSRCFARAGKPLGVCGELAGDPLAAPVLAGLGIRELSMAPGSFPPVREALSRFPLEALEALARDVCRQATAAEVEALLRRKFYS